MHERDLWPGPTYVASRSGHVLQDRPWGQSACPAHYLECPAEVRTQRDRVDCEPVVRGIPTTGSWVFTASILEQPLLDAGMVALAANPRGSKG